MKFGVPSTALALLVGCGGHAATGAGTGSVARASYADDTERVMELERSYWAAEQRQDSAAVEALLAPDYVSMSSQGRGDRSKEAELALLFGGRIHLDAYRFSNMRGVSVVPDVVILHYVVDQRFTLDGRTLCPHSGSMTVWTRRGARWLRVARTEYAIESASSLRSRILGRPQLHLPPSELGASGAAAREPAPIGLEPSVVLSPKSLSPSCGGD